MSAPVKTPPGPFRIRPARRGDATAIGALLTEAGLPCADGQTLGWTISHPEIEVLVATDPTDKPIGMVAFSHRPQLRLNGRICTIDELCVTGSWRRKGVGRALAQKAIERAKALSVKRVEVLDACLPGGREFLGALGFEEASSRVYRLAGT